MCSERTKKKSNWGSKWARHRTKSLFVPMSVFTFSGSVTVSEVKAV